MAKAANNGGGVLLSYGNYAGDVLHFNQAQDRLHAEGIDCRTHRGHRRHLQRPAGPNAPSAAGIAGDLTVFKMAGAAAEAGYDLDDVVAQSPSGPTTAPAPSAWPSPAAPCPAPTDPLFAVPAGRMAVGLGIHGEPGIGETDVPTADELAELLVGRLLAESPTAYRATAGARVGGPILNGLGSVKYDELFVVFGRVAPAPRRRRPARSGPEGGELVTSLDMAGSR